MSNYEDKSWIWISTACISVAIIISSIVFSITYYNTERLAAEKIFAQAGLEQKAELNNRVIWVRK